MNTSVGLDIGSHSIKLVELVKDKTGITLRAAGMSPTPPKSLSSTLAADTEALAVAIKNYSPTPASRRAKSLLRFLNHRYLPALSKCRSYRAASFPPLFNGRRNNISRCRWHR